MRKEITYEKAVQAIETLIQVCTENDCSDCPIQNTCKHFLLSEPCSWEVVDYMLLNRNTFLKLKKAGYAEMRAFCERLYRQGFDDGANYCIMELVERKYG